MTTAFAAVCRIDEAGRAPRGRTLADIDREELVQIAGTLVLDNARCRRLIVALGMIVLEMPDAPPLSKEDREDVDWIVAMRLQDVGLLDEARAFVAAIRLDQAKPKRRRR